MATSFPGATGMLPNDVAGIGHAAVKWLQHAAYGKWHETAVWEISPSGPMDRWPNYQGFDEFYGFMVVRPTSGHLAFSIIKIVSSYPMTLIIIL